MITPTISSTFLIEINKLNQNELRFYFIYGLPLYFAAVYEALLEVRVRPFCVNWPLPNALDILWIPISKSAESVEMETVR